MLTISIVCGGSAAETIVPESYGKDILSFGSAETNDIVIHSKYVSHCHGFFMVRGGSVTIQDNNSTNGLYFNGQRISNLLLRDGMVIRIDDPMSPREMGVVMVVSESVGREVWRTFPLSGRTSVTIGRNRECDICLPHIGVSRLHAQLVLEDGGWHIIDNNSTNGIGLNGCMLNRRARLRENDVIIITNTKLVFSGGSIAYLIPEHGLGLDAVDIVRKVKASGGEKIISNHITLSIAPCEFVAIIGGSGAGKSTFMNCISGYVKADSGSVYINDEDFYANYGAMKNIVGYVPQQDIVYDRLTLWDMLMYAAELRMPSDTSRTEYEERVRHVIAAVELSGHERSMISSLSGGQKKRASIAVELLGDPSLFFLDEPTSGLDPGTERNLMHTLRRMTSDGKTVILVTHNTLNLHLCDKIVFLGRGGSLCFFGTPSEALSFFGVESLVDVYSMLDADTDTWCRRFAQYRSGKAKNVSASSDTSPLGNIKRRKSLFPQLGILCRRYIRLITNDRQRLALLFAQAVLLAVLIWLVADGEQFSEFKITKALAFALACSAFWIGVLNAIQEICKERVILKREYASSMSLGAYILSKFTVLSLFCLVQSLLLSGTFSLLVGLPESGVLTAPFLEYFITTYLCMLSAMGMGLFVSALFDNPDRAMTVAPILLMPQILFSGLAFELSGAVEKISAIVTCRWAVEAYGTSADLNTLLEASYAETPMLTFEPDPFFEFTSAHMLTAWGVLLISVAVFYILSYFTTRLSLRK